MAFSDGLAGNSDRGNPGYGDPLDRSGTAGGFSRAGDQARGAPRKPDGAVRDKLDRNRIAMANGVDSAAGKLRERAHRMPSVRLENSAHSAAGRMEAAAERIRRIDRNRARRRAEDAIAILKANPQIALLAAAGFGFLAGRALAGKPRKGI